MKWAPQLSWSFMQSGRGFVLCMVDSAAAAWTILVSPLLRSFVLQTIQFILAKAFRPFHLVLCGLSFFPFRAMVIWCTLKCSHKQGGESCLLRFFCSLNTLRRKYSHGHRLQRKNNLPLDKPLFVLWDVIHFFAYRKKWKTQINEKKDCLCHFLSFF